MKHHNLLRIIKKAVEHGKRSLDLSRHQIESLPREIGQLKNVLSLNLSNNNLTELPLEIGHLTNLRSLNLGHNQFSTFPSPICQLKRLHSLSLVDNKLEIIPPEIGLLTNLRDLNLIGNQIRELPSEIGQLKNLQSFYLRNNQLTELPPEIGSLTNLPTLDLMNNRLTSLPSEIGQMSRLQSLHLRNNNLPDLPPEIVLLHNLRVLNVANNPIISPPPEIINQGKEAIWAYLRERLRGSNKQWVSKLLVVGEGGVGKTSILRALRNNEFDAQESTTHGIDIGSLKLRHPTETDIKMRLITWDFGGQEIYHATHQFFLTNRSLFLLVWNARLGYEQGRLYYWLDTIKARAPESPVLLVATFIDERDANIPLADLYRKYPQIIGHCEVSNKTGKRISGLRLQIASAAADLPLMGETWPTNWLHAANAIRAKAKQENHILPKSLWQIMAKHKVLSDKALVLAQWLHELGDILYFREDDELNDTVILNPHWVTQSISKVLESEEVINNLGLFTRHHMNELWEDIDPPMRDHFLRLMEKFDLSYRTLENKDISLVVERLDLNPPKYEELWDEIKRRDNCTEISMTFVLDTTMPAGIPTWFIARSHRFTTRTHWRFGALFADGPERKHLGLIQAFPHDRYLTLAVRGTTPHNFFALLLDGLEVTLKRFPGLKITRRIPCPGHDNEACTHEFDLENLHRAIERTPPVYEIQCPVAFSTVSVPRLLVGLHWNLTNQVLTEQSNKILAQVEQLSDGLDEMRALVQREFVKIFYREQKKTEFYCPNVFVLRPHQSDKWMARIYNQAVELQLYCQQPGKWHPTQVGGLYVINQPSEWLKSLAPYIRRMVSVLKYAAPLVGPWLGILSPDQYKEHYFNDIKLMEELVKKLPDTVGMQGSSLGDSTVSVAFEDSDVERVEGAGLRALRLLLDQLDPQQQWGGLRRVLTPEGHYLWLCEHHAKEYS
jgi:internalin A